MISCWWFEQEFNRGNYLCSVGALEALTGVCVCVWGPKVEFPLCLWPDEEGEMMHMPASLCLHAAPCGQKSKLSLNRTCLFFFFCSESEWIRAPNLSPVVPRSQSALVAATCARLHWQWCEQPCLSLQEKSQSAERILNPLKSTDQRHWKGWSGTFRSILEPTPSTHIIWNQTCGLLPFCSWDLTHVHYVRPYRKWCSSWSEWNSKEFLFDPL